MTPEQEKNICSSLKEIQNCISSLNNSLSILVFTLQQLSEPDFTLNNPSRATIAKTLFPHLFADLPEGKL